jgi:hypothetical protein
MAALIAKFCRRGYRVTTMRASDLKFMAAFIAELGTFRIIKLAF